MRKLRHAVMASAVVALAAAGSAAAFQPLPLGDQVNNDPAAGINPALGVDGGDPTNADVVGGAIVANAPPVPWGTFRAHTSAQDQIFVRSFIKSGVWKTQGNGTVGGRSNGSPFTGSLNFDQAQDGEAPAIDFAGANRIVPWATWYEQTTNFNKLNIFASRFDNTGGANQNKWIFGGQGRGLAGGSVPVPSLNIHTNQDAENPSVAGGAAVAGANPGPWVTWQEIGANAPGTGKDQIFTVKPTGPGAANCDGIKPLGVNDGTGHVPAVGGFCWNQVGVERLGADPSQNIDRTRDGVEPDIAFTGTNDTVPWVVWYEKGTSGAGLNNNEMVFASKAVAPGALPTPPTGTVDGGFAWVSVGSGTTTGTQGVLDNTPTTGGFCGQNTTNEAACSLNKNAIKDAEDPRVAAGTMNPANATVPWVTWDEDVNGVKQIFVSRLVGGTHFEVANQGAPISIGANDSTRPDITFSGNTPYVSWREDEGGVTKGFVGHFVNAANPTFVLDDNNVPLTPTGAGAGQADVRTPISSGCIADPFTSDGSNCTGNAIGTPFFLFTNGASPLNLFADAYQPSTPVTNAGATGISTSGGTVSGSVNPKGAVTAVSFDYGTTPSYGSNVSAGKTGPDAPVGLSATPFSAAITGFPAGTTIHFRAVAKSDFGTFAGPDQTFRTAVVPPPLTDGHASIGRASVSGSTASVRASCTGAAGSKCRLSFKLTITETLLGRRIIAISSRAHKRKVIATVGSASVTLNAGQSKIVKVSLGHTGKRLLTSLHTLRTTLRVSQTLLNRHTRTVSTQKVTFKAPKRKHHH
ncbi:MAG: hypothetical protein ACJ76X_14310 [Solirubrobacteraceae bacterium]